jgi:hypothetical protein
LVTEESEGETSAVTMRLNEGPLDRRDAMNAETNPSRPVRDLSLKRDCFEPPLLCSFLCVHRVSAVHWYSPLPQKSATSCLWSPSERADSSGRPSLTAVSGPTARDWIGIHHALRAMNPT